MGPEELSLNPRKGGARLAKIKEKRRKEKAHKKAIKKLKRK